MFSELRQDPILGRWVIVSSERTQRPTDFRYRRESKSSGGFCPFCSGNEYTTPPEILALRRDGSKANGPGWSLRVVPNKFPALRTEASEGLAGERLTRCMQGLGAHEVIIETPEHNASLATMPVEMVVDVLLSYRDRLADLAKDRRLKYAMIFKNHGSSAGATLEHSHTQLIALPVVPAIVAQEIEGSLAYHRETGRCVYCDIVEGELALRRRVVSYNEHFVVLAPYASPHSFETWILPRSHAPLFEDSAGEYGSLARILQDLLCSVAGLLGEPDFNYVLHTAPLREGSLEHYHWHIEITPRLNNTAGFEWGTGFFINPTPPEEAASFLKDALKG